MASYPPYNVFGIPGTPLGQIVGADIASAATIAPVALIHRVTGTAAVVNITVPYTGFSGIVILLPTAVWTWTAAGNIALAGSAVVGKANIFTYNSVTALWYPNYIA